MRAFDHLNLKFPLSNNVRILINVDIHQFLHDTLLAYELGPFVVIPPGLAVKHVIHTGKELRDLIQVALAARVSIERKDQEVELLFDDG
jgi:hypothetical protein